MAIYGVKWLRGNTSLNGQIEYKPNEWMTIPGHGAYVAHTGGLFAAGVWRSSLHGPMPKGDHLALFECEKKVLNISRSGRPLILPRGVTCWRRVRMIDPPPSSEVFKDLIRACVNVNSFTALVCAPEILTACELDRLARKNPILALKFAAGLLTHETLMFCARSSPRYARKYAGHLLSEQELYDIL